MTGQGTSSACPTCGTLFAGCACASGRVSSRDRYVYRCQQQEGSTWWEVVRFYRDDDGIEATTECPVLRFLPQGVADSAAKALTDAFADGRNQGRPDA